MLAKIPITVEFNNIFRHAEVIKKIISTVQDGGGDIGVHMYLFKEFLVLS